MTDCTEIGITPEQTCSPYRWMGEDADAHVKEWQGRERRKIINSAMIDAGVSYTDYLAAAGQYQSVSRYQQQITLSQLAQQTRSLGAMQNRTAKQDFLTGLLQGAAVLR